MDYFKLHKIFYLVEYNYLKIHHSRLTNAYIVRQKDGPYCSDLHFQKIKKAIPEVQIKEINGILVFDYLSALFVGQTQVESTVRDLIKQIIVKYGRLTNAEIKTKVYLTSPMKAFLEAEQHGGLNLYNVPIDFQR